MKKIANGISSCICEYPSNYPQQDDASVSICDSLKKKVSAGEHNVKVYSSGTPHAVKSCHPFLPAMRDITQCVPSAAGLIVISVFSLSFFSYLFFQLITASRLLAPRARDFLSVIFPPPGNYVGAADQTREEADAALKKKSLCIFKSRS